MRRRRGDATSLYNESWATGGRVPPAGSTGTRRSRVGSGGQRSSKLKRRHRARSRTRRGGGGYTTRLSSEIHGQQGDGCHLQAARAHEEAVWDPEASALA